MQTSKLTEKTFSAHNEQCCIQDTLSSRAALGLPGASREQRYLAYNEQGNMKRGENWFPKNYKIILI